MKIDDVITYNDGKEYYILDIVELLGDKYLYCVGIDKEEKPTDEYIYLKAIEENGESYVCEVEDEAILQMLIVTLTQRQLEEDEEQEV